MANQVTLLGQLSVNDATIFFVRNPDKIDLFEAGKQPPHVTILEFPDRIQGIAVSLITPPKKEALPPLPESVKVAALQALSDSLCRIGKIVQSVLNQLLPD